MRYRVGISDYAGVLVTSHVDLNLHVRLIARLLFRVKCRGGVFCVVRPGSLATTFRESPGNDGRKVRSSTLFILAFFPSDCCYYRVSHSLPNPTFL